MKERAADGERAPIGRRSPVLTIGLNPYGLTYTLGLQGMGTARANPHGEGLAGFLRIARECGAACIELDWRWLTPLRDEELDRVAEAIGGLPTIYSHWLAHEPGESIEDAIRRAARIRAGILRMHLTPVLEGARAAWGGRWHELTRHAREVLRQDARRVADAGLVLALENHQDLGSEELLDLAGELGDHVGIVLDTGNPYAVGEDPVAFTRRAAGRIRHLHLKDYVAQFTDEGFRLVRCAVGDGAVPFAEMFAALARERDTLTASMEPGALESRHIRLFAPEWWNGYPPREARELGTMLGRLRRGALADDADPRTPWERGAPGPEIVAYERQHIRRSFENMRLAVREASGRAPASDG